MSARSSGGFENLLKARLGSIRSWVVLCLAWAGVIAWSHKDEMDPDGFSYLQMAARAATGDFSALVNSLWSPGYPALLAVLLAGFRPSPESAFAVAHLLNYLLFIVAAVAFLYFLRGFVARNHEYDWLLVPLGFVLFFKFAMDWLGVHNCTPDLGVGAVVLFVAGIVVRLGTEGPRQFPLLVLLGFVLGIGYYVKAPLFLLSIFLLLLLLCVPPPRISRPSILIAVLSFSIVAAPLIVLQTRKAGHLSFGESGNLNYAWWVNGIRGIHHGGPIDPRGHFIHPPRHITEHPVTLEFGVPVQATYPLWFDPYYWTEGMHRSFDLRQQIAAFRVALADYVEMFLPLAVLIVSAILFFSLSPHRDWGFIRHGDWLILWPAGALILYAAVHVEARYIGGFMILFWIEILSIGLRSTRIAAHGAIVAIIGIILLTPATLRLALAGERIVTNVINPMPTGEATVARTLNSLGVHEGDGILVVGETYEPYYAWIAGLRVVAQVPDQNELWALNTSDFQNWTATVAHSGAKAMVAIDRPAFANQVSWHDLPVSSRSNSTILGSHPHRYSIRLLP